MNLHAYGLAELYRQLHNAGYHQWRVRACTAVAVPQSPGYWRKHGIAVSDEQKQDIIMLGHRRDDVWTAALRPEHSPGWRHLGTAKTQADAMKKAINALHAEQTIPAKKHRTPVNDLCNTQNSRQQP